MGCDEAILLSARAFAGADTWATAYTLAQGIRQVGDYDLILCGKQAMDGSPTQVVKILQEKDVNIADADIIVSGGRGVGRPRDSSPCSSWRTCWAARWEPRAPLWTRAGFPTHTR